jgi:hypothetical protein
MTTDSNRQLAQALTGYADSLMAHDAPSDLLSDYERILSPIVDERLLPVIYAFGWVIVKHYDERASAWPKQAYEDLRIAERWREFLEDYYYNVYIEGGRELWTVERLCVSLNNFDDPGRPVGDGYTERHGWAGTLPMRVYTRAAGGGWRRIESDAVSSTGEEQ